MSRAAHTTKRLGKLRAVIYTRVSSDKRKKFKSTDEQEFECRADAEMLDLDVVAVFCDNSIGASKFSRGDRPGWLAARAYLEAGKADVLITWESSRAQRDIEAFAALKRECIDHGFTWCYGGNIYDMTNADDAYRAGQDALNAEREAALTSMRVTRSSNTAARKGKPWGPCPIGYVRKYDENTRELIGQFINPATAPIVRELIEGVLSGASLSSLSKMLNERGVATGKGAAWTNHTVRQVVMNPSYAGLRAHSPRDAKNNKLSTELHAAEWEAIISVEDHHAVVAMLNDPRRRVQKQNKRKHILSGVAQCAVCLSTVSVLNVHNKGTRRYTCKRGQHTAIAADFIEKIVLDAIITRFESRSELSIDDAPSNDVLAAQAEIDSLRAQLAEALASTALADKSKRMSISSFVALEAMINAEIADLEKTLHVTPFPSTIAAMRKAENPRVFWDALSLDQQAVMLRSMMSIKIARCATPGSKRVDPDRIEIEWLV